MFKLFAMWFAIVVAAILPGVGVADASTPSVDPGIQAKAKEWYHRFQTGSIDRSQLDARCNETTTAFFIQREKKLLQPLGSPTKFAFVSAEPVGGAMGYDFAVWLPRGRVIESIAFDGDGKIAGINFETFVPNDGSGTSQLRRRR